MYFTFPLDTFIGNTLKRKPDTDTSKQININTTFKIRTKPQFKKRISEWKNVNNK